MNWRGAPKDIVVVSERENHAQIRSFLQQLERLGYGVHVIARATYEFTRRVPSPQLVLFDAGNREFRQTGNPPANLRATWEYVPIVLLARTDELANMSFNGDFHGLLTIPVTPQELDARIRFAQWKSQGAAPQREILEVANLRMDLATYEVWVDEAPVELTFKEFELLKYFLNHQRRVFTRAELLETVWETDYFGGTRTVDVHIRRLRSKLGDTVGNMIHTVRNVGYRFG
jgi:DNA-binding response OmpR family regulator